MYLKGKCEKLNIKPFPARPCLRITRESLIKTDNANLDEIGRLLAYLMSILIEIYYSFIPKYNVDGEATHVPINLLTTILI